MSVVTFKNSDRITDTCSICCEEVSYGAAHKVGEVFHRFHAVCLGTWLKGQQSCPTCRNRMTHINGELIENPAVPIAHRIVTLLADPEAGEKITTAARENNVEQVRALLTDRYISLNNIVRALMQAAANGNIDIVRELLGYSLTGSEIPYQVTGSAALEAAKKGHHDIFHLLLNDPRKTEQYKNNVRYSTAGRAAAEGCIDVVSQLLISRNIPDPERKIPLLAAAENGHTDIVRLLAIGYTIPNGVFNRAMIRAAERGHHGVVHLLLSTDHPALKSCLAPAIDAASRNGHFKTAALLYSAALAQAERTDDPDMSLIRNARAGKTFMVSLLHEVTYLVDTSRFYRDCALIGAAEKGHLEIVRTLARSYIHISNTVRSHAIERAAANGHLEIVRKLFTSRGIPIEPAILAAAKNGHFKIVGLLLAGSLAP